MKLTRAFMLFFLCAAISTPAAAHSGLKGADTLFGAFLSGLSHPVQGLDHFLAMLAVGFVSIFYTRRDLFLVPIIFLLFMLAGFIIPVQFPDFDWVDQGIAFSVIAFGVIIWRQGKIPRFAVYVFTAIFAAFHGIAHGVEMPAVSNSAPYALGFLFGTAAIHLAGMLLAENLKSPTGQAPLIRLTSILMIATGLYFLQLPFNFESLIDG